MKVIIIVSVGLLLTACGQKGALYMPTNFSASVAAQSTLEQHDGQ